jgi:hypothetical protein
MLTVSGIGLPSWWLFRSQKGALGISEFLVASTVTVVVDEFLGGCHVFQRRFAWLRSLAAEEASAVVVNAGLGAEDAYHRDEA